MRTTSDDPAARQRPPLTKRMGPRHWTALDYVAGGLTTVILWTAVRHALRAAEFFPQFGGLHFFPLPATGALAFLVVATAGVAVALRRRRPVFMLGLLLAGSMVATALTGPDFSVLTYFLPVAYVLYLVASTYERRRDAARVLVAVYITLVTDTVLLMIGWGGFFNEGGLISVALCVIVVWTIGYTVRQRRRYAVSLQEEAASKAVAQERLRIARELHDVVAHSMSVIAVQAGYGQYVIDSQPGDARAALGAIQATSREALDEMRRMLGALRHADEGSQGDGAPHSPAGGRPGLDGAWPASGGQDPGGGAPAPLLPSPGLGDLDRLVARTARAGVRVEVTRRGEPRDLPASIDLSAYRIVQEALTNVVKHARTSACRVLVGYGHDQLTLEVTDNGAGRPELVAAAMELAGSTILAGSGGPTPGGGRAAMNGIRAGHATDPVPGAGGHGIIGMRERVTLLGGEFSAGPLPGYGFQVVAHIPLPPGPGGA